MAEVATAEPPRLMGRFMLTVAESMKEPVVLLVAV
jgi:hypothetical protein